MVQLAVVSKVQFEKHLLETKKVVKPIIDVKPTYHCEICSKKFKTDAMLKNHNTSKRHLERLSEIEHMEEMKYSELQKQNFLKKKEDIP